MKQFRADLHIHSRFSRATSKSLTPRNLAAWAKVKGIDVLGTGDFTHPEWIEELKEQLEEDGNGLFKLKTEQGLGREIPVFGGSIPGGSPRFMLQAEISSIYKRGGKVRKNHNLVFMPSFEAAEKLNLRLAEIGNIASDGRPILGLDSRHLLEMVLETDPQAYLIPAHIWTPWFSLFGSKSGFDSIEECFGELSSEIFALETGLSSDPEMNWMWSALDRFSLISNSDAHSGEKLGRETNIFSGDVGYETVFNALRGEGLGAKFLGTTEFFPEEGKYHLDGHRKCGVVMEPTETLSRGGMCPVCGKPMTVGVLNRVLTLADREIPERPEKSPGYDSLIPLAEVCGEILGVGPKTKKATGLYVRAVSRIGSEMSVLQDAPLEELDKVSPFLAEAVSRMRKGQVFRNPGFDGQFGVIRVFTEKERAEMKSGGTLLTMPAVRKNSGRDAQKTLSLLNKAEEKEDPQTSELNPAQLKATMAGPHPVMVLAGPGTGKTRTLIGRIERLLEGGENPRHVLAVTFTRRAAEEMRQRLSTMRGDAEALPRADTLHALAFEVWEQAYGDAPVVMNEEGAFRVFAECNPDLTGSALKQAWNAVMLSRETMEPNEEYADAQHGYTKQKESWNLVDYTDLLEFWLEQIKADIWPNPYTHILVDEIQDLSRLQVELITRLAGKDGRGFFGIGDPNQSIYSFRGALPDVDKILAEEWAELELIQLLENYRSGSEILKLSGALFPMTTALTPFVNEPGEISQFSAPSADREASWIGDQVRKLIGGTSLSQAGDDANLSPGDVAVLVRFKALIPLIRKTLERVGIPCAAPENEAFWVEPRVALILKAAARFLGVSGDDEEAGLDVPEKVLAKGPLGLAAYLEDIRPFDQMFWKSTAFRKLAGMYEEQGGWAGLMNWINLRSELEEVRLRAEKVQIMSVHAAKGLEFEAVFMPGLEDGIFPFAGSDFLTGKSTEQLDEEEERRLLFVGLTRARKCLFLSNANKRMLYGNELVLKPSRFLAELPTSSIKRSRLASRKVRQEKTLSLI